MPRYCTGRASSHSSQGRDKAGVNEGLHTRRNVTVAGQASANLPSLSPSAPHQRLRIIPVTTPSPLLARPQSHPTSPTPTLHRRTGPSRSLTLDPALAYYFLFAQNSAHRLSPLKNKGECRAQRAEGGRGPLRSERRALPFNASAADFWPGFQDSDRPCPISAQ